MSEIISFKTRVRDVAVHCASQYDSYFVRKSYLVMSDVFKKHPYYIIEAQPTNYLHLVGVSSHLPADEFFSRCLSESLSEGDFELSFHGRDLKFSKGSIRQKIRTLPKIAGILSGASHVEEDFEKNVVRCSLATSNGSCTLGFIATPLARPMTLLRGDELHADKAGTFSIILAKARSADYFSETILGTDKDFLRHYNILQDKVGEPLRGRIVALQQQDNTCNFTDEKT